MPYTLAHPITAIALVKLFPGRFNKTGLAFGTLVPDLQNFIALRPTDSDFGHSPLGMLTLGLPVSVALAFAFHRLVVPAAADCLPAPYDRIAGVYAQQGWRIAGLRDWAVLLVSIGLGMYSHLFLDGFSHRGGLMYPFAVGTVQWLFPGVRSPGSLLQFGLSLAGMAVELLLLIVFLRRRKAALPPVSPPGSRPKSQPAVAAEAPTAGAAAKTLYGLAILAAIALFTAAGIYSFRFGHFRYALLVMPIAPFTGAAVGLLAASAFRLLFRKTGRQRMRL